MLYSCKSSDHIIESDYTLTKMEENYYINVFQGFIPF